ncbi:MAG: lactoylglutathione lyase [Synechococcaceae bacterium WB8_1B_136]|nr:lactoylglutathione lyase [Synechococcaceae bacterium WB8_1B_136]
MALPHIHSIGFSCGNAEQLAAFYCRELGFQLGSSLELEAGGYADLLGLPGSRLKLQRLHLGEEVLELTQVLERGRGLRAGRPIPADSRSNDLWFQHICIVVADLAAAAAPIQVLEQQGRLRAISSAPQTLPSWNQAAAGIQAYKFHDPEGHCLELLQFPTDKGDARWHQAAAQRSANASPCLGIDHSAIANADTARSCRFYEQLLGLELGGDGVNSGIEQDHLDGLESTRVRITSHRCSSGAGVECLNYLEPANGRPMPADQSAADLAHWQIRLQVDDLEALAPQLEAHGGSAVTAGPVSLDPEQAQLLGFRHALQIRDPDGHQLQLVCG